MPTGGAFPAPTPLYLKIDIFVEADYDMRNGGGLGGEGVSEAPGGLLTLVIQPVCSVFTCCLLRLSLLFTLPK